MESIMTTTRAAAAATTNRRKRKRKRDGDDNEASIRQSSLRKRRASVPDRRPRVHLRLTADSARADIEDGVEEHIEQALRGGRERRAMAQLECCPTADEPIVLSVSRAQEMRHRPRLERCQDRLMMGGQQLDGSQCERDERGGDLEARRRAEGSNCRPDDWPGLAREVSEETPEVVGITNNLSRHQQASRKVSFRQHYATCIEHSRSEPVESIEDIELKALRRKHNQHRLPTLNESCSSSISFIIKLVLISHLLQLLVASTRNDDGGSSAVRWWPRSAGSRKTLAGFPSEGRHYLPGALLVAALESERAATSRTEDKPPAGGEWLAVGEATEPEVAGASNQNDDEHSHPNELLNADGLLLYQTAADADDLKQQQQQQQLPQTASPLDFIKHKHPHHHHQSSNHNYRPHHRHHHNHQQHHHNRRRQQQPTKPEADKHEDSGAKLEGEEERRRFRRHYGGYWDGTAADRPVVASRKGLVRGVTQKLFTGKFVDAFLGIPYAKPPNGTYRFRHPQPKDSWEGELDASRLPNSCYQVNDTFFGANFQGTVIWNANTPLSEDCLYLNIWSPFGVANTTVPSTPNKVYRPPPPPNPSGELKASKRPVLVWIFGGGFYYGTSTLALYEGGLLASEEDIIVVSINYRVSALGFLYFGRPDAPGNAGLFDQLLALQWIQDNIDQFGGDPSRVTIFGESAGAVSAAFHLLSPLSRNLFSQAILQSGAATCPWGCMEPREIMTNGLKLAHQLNCPSNASDLDSVLGCLHQIDPMLMVATAQDVDPGLGLLNFPFVPVVDGSFLLESPSESLIKSNFKRARILLGSNYDEGSAFLIYLTEFSHCPGGSPDAGPDLPAGPSEPPAATTTTTGHPPRKQTPPPADAFGPELNMDQSIESMELLAPSTGNGHHSAALLAAAYAPNEAAPLLANEGGGLGAGGRTTQNNLPPNYSESNPCKPNESPALTRDGFLRTLNKHLNPYAEHPVGKEAIVFEYSNWNNPHDSVSNYDALDKIVGDYHFTCHVNEFAQRYASTGNAVYMYYFKQRSSVSQWPKWMGVMHGDEIAFIFGEPLNQMLNYTAREVELSRRMMKYWANFAKTGNPTKLSENTSMTEKWPEYASNRQYFELHGDFIRIGRGPRSKQCAFWAHYLPKLIDSFDHSQCPATSSGKSPHSHSRQCPPMYHPLDPSYSHADQRNYGPLANLPSLVIVCLSVILVLSLLGLLVYAKRTGKLELNLTGSGSGSD